MSDFEPLPLTVMSICDVTVNGGSVFRLRLAFVRATIINYRQHQTTMVAMLLEVGVHSTVKTLHPLSNHNTIE